VKVWPVPVRVIHWLLVANLMVLALTGLYIGTPGVVLGAGPGLIMSWVRAIHIGFGFGLIALLTGRVIYMFTGPRYARWDLVCRRSPHAALVGSVNPALLSDPIARLRSMRDGEKAALMWFSRRRVTASWPF
jgi:Ni,Fe-hydrogenase I cytochrome b subunit